MTGRTQYAYALKHRPHLFTHTTSSEWSMQAAVSWHHLIKWTQRQLQKFTYKNKSTFDNTKKKRYRMCVIIAEYPKNEMEYIQSI